MRSRAEKLPRLGRQLGWRRRLQRGRSLPAAQVAQGLAVPFRLKPQEELGVGVITRSVCGV